MIFTKRTFKTEVVVTAGTVVAYSALYTDVSVCTVFAVFAAFGTHIGTFRAACTAGTDHIYAILTFLTFLAVVALAAYTVPAGCAGKADLVRCAFGAFFETFLTSQRAV